MNKWMVTSGTITGILQMHTHIAKNVDILDVSEIQNTDYLLADPLPYPT